MVDYAALRSRLWDVNIEYSAAVEDQDGSQSFPHGPIEGGAENADGAVGRRNRAAAGERQPDVAGCSSSVGIDVRTRQCGVLARSLTDACSRYSCFPRCGGDLGDSWGKT